jgi:pilus assembly protein CpaF
MPQNATEPGPDYPMAVPVTAADVAVDTARLDEVRARVLGKLTQKLDLEELKRLPDDRRAGSLRPVVETLLDRDNAAVTRREREDLVQDVLDEILGLGPLERLLRDQTNSDILVNGPREVYVERAGRLQESAVHFRDNDHLLQIIERIVSRVGRRIDDSHPLVDARLPDGSRVNAIVPPLALKGPTLSIRRFGAEQLQLEDLLRLQAVTPEMAVFFEAAVRGRLNIVISGGTGSGKTTLLNALSRLIPNDERIVTIEDAAELKLQQRHVVPLETRPENMDGKGAVTMRDLVRNALRMRPDRIVIGECRGPEAFDMLQAMNSGHEGSLTTLHANSPRDTLSRLETLMMMAGFDIPIKALRRHIASAVQLIIQAERSPGGARKVTSVTELVGMEGDIIASQEIFAYHQKGIDEDGHAHGQFVTTGVRPHTARRLKVAGAELPTHMFAQRVLLRT